MTDCAVCLRNMTDQATICLHCAEHLHIAASAWATAVITAHCPGCRGHLEENR